MDDYLLDAANGEWPNIRMLYRPFQDKKLVLQQRRRPFDLEPTEHAQIEAIFSYQLFFR